MNVEREDFDRHRQAVQQNFDALVGMNRSNVKELNKLADDVAKIMDFLGVQSEGDDVVGVGTSGNATNSHDELEDVSANDHHNQSHDQGDHNVAETADIQPIGTSNDAGTSVEVPNADHVHQHGTFPTGDLHPEYTAGIDDERNLNRRKPPGGLYEHEHDPAYFFIPPDKVLGDDAPMDVAVLGSPGLGGEASRDDHVHPHGTGYDGGHTDVLDHEHTATGDGGNYIDADIILAEGFLESFGGFALAGTESVTWTTDKNDYRPNSGTGDYTATVVELTANDVTITGLFTESIGVAHHNEHGRVYLILNSTTSTFNLIIADEDAGSTAVRRFHLPDGDLTLEPGKAALFFYELDVASRWFMVGGTGGTGGSGVDVEDDATPVATATTIDFGTGLDVTDDGGGHVTVDATGGSSTITVQEDDVNVDTAVSTIDFRHGLDVTSSPAGEANVSVDESELDHASLANLTSGDPHTQYRLESADHDHTSTGLQGGVISSAGPDADITIDSAGAAGTAGTEARSGHGHKVSTSSATPSAVSTSGAAGSTGAISRADHTHAHEAAHVVHDTLWDAKGDLVAGTGADTAAKVTVGTDGQVLMADAASTPGVKWADVAAAGTRTDYIWALPGDVLYDDAVALTGGTTPHLVGQSRFNEADGRAGLFFTFGVPGDWDGTSAMSLTLIWYSATSTGNVVWTAQVDNLASGQDPVGPPTNLSNGGAGGIAVADSTTAKYTTITTWDSAADARFTPSAKGDIIMVNVERNASHANDTATGNVRLLAVRVNYTAVGIKGDTGATGAAGATDDWFYGDGSDGTVDFDGTNTFSGFTSTTGAAPNLVYTLTRDVMAGALTVRSGKTLKTGGYRIFASSVTVESTGTIQMNGNDAVANVAGAALPTASLTDNTGGGGAGRNNTSGAGSNSAAAAQSAMSATTGSGSGKGGVGGAAGVNAAGSVGAITLMTAAEGGAGGTFIRNPIAAIPWHLRAQASAANDTPHTGNGGSGGGCTTGTGTTVSGGGGGVGGCVMIIAKTITNNGTISANGGNGATATATGTGVGGGGGGGGGGIVICYTRTFTGNTPTATKGTAGSGVGGGGNGTDGSDGRVVTVTGP